MQQTRQEMLGDTVVASELPTWSTEEMQAQYDRARELHRQRICEIAEQRLPERKQRVEQEFSDWWGRRPAEWREGCVQPEDVVTFMEHFLQKHNGRARTITESGERVIHFNTVEKQVSHLCSWFRRRGLEGEWRTDGCKGNPCKSECVRIWKRAYRSAQQVRGVGESSAEPLKVDWYHRMLAACRETALKSRDANVQGRAARDAMMLAFLWETGQRVRPQLGPYTRDMVVDESGCPVWSFREGRRTVSGPLMLDVWTLKTTTEFRPGRVNLPVAGAFMSWFDYFGQWLRVNHRADVVMLFPRWSGAQGVTNSSIDSMEATRIMRQWAREVGAPSGLTYYSSKRGALQHRYHELGVPLGEIATQTLLKSRNTVERYVDRGRHWHRQVQNERRERARLNGGEKDVGVHSPVWGGPPPALEARLRAQESQKQQCT